VLPVFNNRETVRRVALDCRSHLENVLVVDDGSTDADVEGLLAGTGIPVLRHETNRGKGQAILTAWRFVEARGGVFMITIDADGQHHPADLLRFLPLLEQDRPVLVVGCRRFEGAQVPSSSRFGRAFANFWLRVEAGVRHLDGRTALMYARSRHGRSIFDRAIRQQAILLGLRDRLLELGPTRIASAIPHLQRTVRTEIGPLDAIKLARRLHRIKREHIHGLVLDPRHADVTTVDGRWVMVPKPEAIREALAHLFEARAPGLRRSAACPAEDAALR